MWVVDGTETIQAPSSNPSGPLVIGPAPLYSPGTVLRLVTLVDDATLELGGNFACGIVTTLVLRTTPSEQGAPLVPGRPSAVTVARYGPTAGFPPLPPEKVITNTYASTVARLVRDVNSLPAFPPGTISCPFDDGSYYQVEFSYADGGSRTLHVERRGCQGVGLAELPQHSVAWSATDPRFLNDLDALFE
jgi:hypothetical protein